MIRRICLGIALVMCLFTALAQPASALDDDGTSGPPPQNLPTYTIDQAKLPFAALPGTTTTRKWGVLDGAGYHIEVPASWNGELVMYAHGFAGNGAELAVQDPPMRPWLIANGFAWAASSYARNGYVVEQGARDTLKLAKLFAKNHGQPKRRYLTGVSMGGHITSFSIEKNHGFYDGALPACGVLGDRELFNYFQGFHLLAQAITGVTATFPTPVDYPVKTLPGLVAALGGPTGAGYQQLAAATQQMTGGSRVGFGVAYASWFDFLLTVGSGAPGDAAYPSDNTGAVYQLDGDPALNAVEAALNAKVRQARRLDYPTPDGVWSVAKVMGRFNIPVLTMHTVGDLFVPISMEQSYANKAEAQGSSDWLVQRAIRDVGHCSFSEAEWNRSMTDLVSWVRDGKKPAGDSMFEGLNEPSYGCQFSDNSGLFKGTAARAAFGACPAS